MNITDLELRIPHIESQLGCTFKNRQLLIDAFIHPSYANENKSLQDNQRLEFLGDGVLGLIVAEYLYQKFPDQPEGFLSNMRSMIVDSSRCSQFLTKLEVGQFLLIGRGERINIARGKERMMADLFEAIIGAIYLDQGLEIAKKIVLTHFVGDFEKILLLPPRNFKAELQELIQKRKKLTPTYRVASESGPDHLKRFVIIVSVEDEDLGIGEGNAKKIAEQKAAEDALQQIALKDQSESS